MSALADQFEVLDDDVDLSDLLVRVASAAQGTKISPLRRIADDPAVLEELATRWDEHQHPRWPKGTKDPATGHSKAGQFMESGQQFMHDGKRYEIAFFGPKGSGVLYAHRAGGANDVGLERFTVAQKGGGDSGSQPTIAGAQPAEAIELSKGKGTMNNLTVSPFVENDHDPSLELPTGIPGMKVKAEGWKKFGRADQENFIRLAQEFGKYDSGENAAMVAKLKSQLDAKALSDVEQAYVSQHYSSTGTNFNFAQFVHGITDKMKLTSGQARREKAKQALQEVASVVQWDLYNRTGAPDVTVFHRSDESASLWKQRFWNGDKPVMSGMSQSWRYGVWHGDTVVVMPLAIRSIVMSTHSVHVKKALGSGGGYEGEKEIATPDQLKMDDRAVVFSENQQLKGNGIKEWLSTETSSPASGDIARQLVEYMNSGKIPPLPPPKPVITMQGQSKLWVDPPFDIGADITTAFGGKPFDAPKTVGQLGYLTDSSGEPLVKAANSWDLKAGDLIEGMQGSRYVILDDPGSTNGFPYVRAELNSDGSWQGPTKTFTFSNGGDKMFKKLDGHVSVPKPQMLADTGPLWDPDAWANGVDAVETAKLPDGSIFKVNDVPYQVVSTGGGNVQIKDLNTGKLGSINGDYQAQAMVPKHGYVAVDTSHETKVDVGVTFAYQGEKYVVTKQLKGTGQWQAKRVTGSGVIKLNPDDPALEASNLHDPAAWDIADDETAIGSLTVGQKFHGGTGQLTQKPYVVTGQEDGKTLARNLDTGAEVSLSAKKKYRLLVPKAAAQQSDAPSNPDQHIPQNWKVNVEGAPLPDGHQPAGSFGPGEKFVVANEDGNPIPEFHYEATGDVVQGKGLVVKVLTGPQAGTTAFANVDQSVFPLEPVEDPLGPVSAFNPTNYQDGPTRKVDDMPVGTVFVGGKGVPYVLKKKGPKSGAVATNLITGKPYPAIAYSKEFKTLEPTKLGQVPYSKLKQGDQVVVSKLLPGDQFANGQGGLFEIVSSSPEEELGPKVAFVSYYGKGDAEYLPSPEMLVTFHAKSGAGYDPANVAPPLPIDVDGYSPETSAPDDPLHAMPDAAEGNFVGVGNGIPLYTMPKGTGFIDGNGKAWFVKQTGNTTMVIGDGAKNYKVDSMLEGAAPAKEVLPLIDVIKTHDHAPPVAGPNESGIQAEKMVAFASLKPNSNLLLSDLDVGDWIVAKPGGDMVKVVQKDEDWTTVQHPETGVEVPVSSLSKVVPAQVAKMVSPSKEGFNPDVYIAELKSSKVGDLEPGDVFVNSAGTAFKLNEWEPNGHYAAVTNLDVGNSTSVSVEAPVTKMIPKPSGNDSASVTPIPDTTGWVKLPGMVATSQLRPGMVIAPGATQATPFVVNDDGTATEILPSGSAAVPMQYHLGADEKFKRLVPPDHPGVRGLDEQGLPVYAEGDQVFFKNQVWQVYGVSSGGSILGLESKDGTQTKIGKGNVEPVKVKSMGTLAAVDADSGDAAPQPETTVMKKFTDADLADGKVATDDHTLVLTKGAGGTTGAMFAKDVDGNLWLVKSYGGNQPDRVATEWLTNQLYQQMGAKVPNGQLKLMDGKQVYCYPAAAGTPGGSALKITSPNPQLGKHMMMDALTANWDVVGLTQDNLLWPPGTTQAQIDAGTVEPYRLDQGGTLFYRAQGQKKDFGSVPGEVESLLTGAGQGAKTMLVTEDDKKSQAKAIWQTLTPAVVNQLVAQAPFADEQMRKDVAAALNGRIAWMADLGKDAPAPHAPTPPPDLPTLLPNAGGLSLEELDPGDYFGNSDGAIFKVDAKKAGGKLHSTIVQHGGVFAPDEVGDEKVWEDPDGVPAMVWMRNPPKAPEPPKSEPITVLHTGGGVFKVGDEVEVWAPAWSAPAAGKLVTIEANGQAMVQYPGDVPTHVEGSWLSKPGTFIEKPEMQVGWQVTHKSPLDMGGVGNPPTKTGTMLSLPDAGGWAQIQYPDGSVATINDQAFIKSGPPTEEPTLHPGDFVLPSQLKVGDHIEVQTKGDTKPLFRIAGLDHPDEGFVMKLEFVANPTAGHKVGDVLNWTGGDADVQAGAKPGDPSPWKLVDAPPVAGVHASLPLLPAIVAKHGGIYLHSVKEGDLLNPLAGGGGHVYEVHHTDSTHVYVEDVDSGEQHEWPKVVGGSAEYAYLIPKSPGQTTGAAIVAWNHQQQVLSGKIPPTAPPVAKPAGPQHPPGYMSAVDALQKVKEQHGGAPPTVDEKGYGSEWGSGGGYRYRPFNWLPDGAVLHLKSGGKWMKLNAAGWVVNTDSGVAKRLADTSIRVKPPQGLTWKVDAEH